MDHEHFDTLARRVFTDLRQSRRAAVATLLGAALLGQAPSTVLAKKAKAQAKVCYPSGTHCKPGRGKNTPGCDFSNATAFFEGDFRGANLSKSNFTGAQMARADFRGANLSGACLVSASLQAAKLGSSVNLDKAIFCNTLMPDGTFNDRDCDKDTACCPTPPPICEECGDACRKPGNSCFPLLDPCCARYECTPTLLFGVTACAIPCGVDSDCRFWGEGGKCEYDINNCPFMDRCCVFPRS
jgi:hypothetical protein